MKQTTHMKGDSNNPKNGVKLNLKPTLRNKTNKTREKHMKGGQLQR
jgi:hypothetical protein